MRYSDEQRISQAVHQRDATALAAAVKRLPSYDRDYSEVRNVVESAGGGRFVHFGYICMDETRITNRLGKAEVREETW